MTPDDRFTRCVQFVCQPVIEGGFANLPDDPGGPTNYGITLVTLSSWRGAPCTVADIQALQLPEAFAIYRSMYWRPICGDSLPSGVDLITFDAAVNQGPGTAIRFLQKALSVKADGVVGPVTLTAVAKLPPNSLIAGIEAQRWLKYESTPGYATFGHGWESRLNRVTIQARDWVE